MRYKVFIHHDGALGDVLLSLPIIYLLKGNSFLHLATRKDIGEFSIQASLINETSRVDSLFYTPLYYHTLTPELRAFLSQFNRAVIFSAKFPAAIGENIKKVIPDTIVIKTISDEDPDINIAEYRLRQFLGHNKKTKIKNLFTYQFASKIIEIPEKIMTEAKEFLSDRGFDTLMPILAIHPGSGSLQKCWPLENYLSLTELLMQSLDIFVIILTGPAESLAFKKKIDDFIRGRKNIIHIAESTLITIASFLRLSDIYLGNDSGVSHLSALLCKRVLIIFGPTNHNVWRPPYNNVKGLVPKIECAPCSSFHLQRCNNKKCLSTIYISRVYEEIKNSLKKEDLHEITLWKG